MNLKSRPIKLWLIGLNGLFYRLFVISCQSVFFYILQGSWKWAVGTSIVWNIINMCLYYTWHISFAKLFKVGKD